MNNFDKDVDNISLCFSGGGLRATFFHLGTFLALKDAGYTKNINEIYSVSGGSIAAAHIVLNWDKYNDTNQTELEATKELIGAGSLDIRGRVFRRELILLMSLPFFNQFLSFFGFPIIWPRTKIAIDQYKNLFERKKLNDLSSDGTPKLYLLATSLTKGKVAAFGREGLSIGSEKYEGEEIQIALAVAASSAFPPLFPPITLPAKMFGARRDRFPVDEELLSDGGVYDNLGCYIPMNRGSSDWIVLSDASASIDNIYNKSFNSLVSRAVRSTNIVMERLSEETLKALHERGKFAHVRIGNLRFA
ncbi:patatin-like phospholipase family protein [Methylobacterium sp. AMS5]|uniref:patatin-like phospholipase family protein n=1 Tax=Methylobacterium sp. AMS5 TaxID=925818 RepID=UPI00130DA89D|nr:patatin-like phospholipase family protein [Methylobacterium sp. AMS5]